jgi:hypothetical protein
MTFSGSYEFIPNTDSEWAELWAGTHILTDFTVDLDMSDVIAMYEAMDFDVTQFFVGSEEEPVDDDNESHPCTHSDCTVTVPYDDEPFCFDHSPDHGSTVPGYSYKAAVRQVIDSAADL